MLHTDADKVHIDRHPQRIVSVLQKIGVIFFGDGPERYIVLSTRFRLTSTELVEQIKDPLTVEAAAHEHAPDLDTIRKILKEAIEFSAVLKEIMEGKHTRGDIDTFAESTGELRLDIGRKGPFGLGATDHASKNVTVFRIGRRLTVNDGEGTVTDHKDTLRRVSETSLFDHTEVTTVRAVKGIHDVVRRHVHAHHQTCAVRRPNVEIARLAARQIQYTLTVP
jgi:hypothetical protein